MGYPSKNRNWEQRNGYGRKYGNGNKHQQRRAHGGTTTQTQTHHTTPKGRGPYQNTPSRRISGRQGNGEDKDDKNRKKYRDTKYDFEEENEEESDTEDSFEFEITPQQLSQVTPGGGVLKLTLPIKGPLKITTEAQKKPDPSQTTVKTVYDPTKEKEPLQGSRSIRDKTTYRERENFESQRIKPKETPNGKRDEGFPEGAGPIGQVKPSGNGGPDRNGGPDKDRKPPRKGEGPPDGFRKINGGGGDQILVMMMGIEVDLPLPHQKTLHQEEGIGGPSLSMCCRDLLDHQVRWANQVKQVQMEEMAKHPN